MDVTADQTLEMLNDFVKTITAKGQPGEKNIYCFVEQIDEINIGNFVGRDLQGIKDLFYFTKPEDEFELLTLGKFSELVEHENSFQSLSKKFISLKDKIKFSKTEPGFDSFPLFQCSVKFNSKFQTDEWMQFSRFSFSIPEFIFLQE